jgi:type IV pilus assembly protein PilE
MEQMQMKTTSHRGFTLIELVVAITVIGLLTTIALPSYNNYVARSHRTDAKGALVGLANAMDRYFAVNNSYVGATLGAGGIYAAETPLDGGTKYYDLTIASVTTIAYTVYAIPKNGQAGDGRLTLDSTGNRQWNSKDDGTGSNTTW